MIHSNNRTPNKNDEYCIAFGTRPELIKLIPIMIKMKENCKLLFTGQHPDLVNPILESFKIQNIHHLPSLTQLPTLDDKGAAILKGVGHFLNDNNIKLLIVHGDTSTAFFSALATFHQKIPIAHIEAGLRSGDLASPFPEEGYRKLITHISEYHFAPTEEDKETLSKENINPDKIWVTGNTVIDTLHLALDRLKENPKCLSDLKTNLKKEGLAENRPYFLITCHRRENWGKNLSSILIALKKINKDYPDYYLI